jgi:hypothetical protein
MLDAAKISGIPKNMSFNFKKLHFYFEFTTNSKNDRKSDMNGISWGSITELFIPNFHYEGLEVMIDVSDGIYRYDKGRQSIYWRYDPNYRGSSSKDFDPFDDDQGLYGFVVSFITLFFTWIFSLFRVAPIQMGKNEVIHWISIRPSKPI